MMQYAVGMMIATAGLVALSRADVDDDAEEVGEGGLVSMRCEAEEALAAAQENR